MITEDNYKTPMEFLVSVQAVSIGRPPLPFTAVSARARWSACLRKQLVLATYERVRTMNGTPYADLHWGSRGGGGLPVDLITPYRPTDASPLSPSSLYRDEVLYALSAELIAFTAHMPREIQKHMAYLARVSNMIMFPHSGESVSHRDSNNYPPPEREADGTCAKVSILTPRGSVSDNVQCRDVVEYSRISLEEEITYPNGPVLVWRDVVLDPNVILGECSNNFYRNTQPIMRADNFVALSHPKNAVDLSVTVTRYRCRETTSQCRFGPRFLLGHSTVLDQELGGINPVDAFAAELLIVRCLPRRHRPGIPLHELLAPLGDDGRIARIVRKVSDLAQRRRQMAPHFDTLNERLENIALDWGHG